jgi:hypothetical protein
MKDKRRSQFLENNYPEKNFEEVRATPKRSQHHSSPANQSQGKANDANETGQQYAMDKKTKNPQKQ